MEGPAAGLEGIDGRWRWTAADRRPGQRGEGDTDGDEERGKLSSAGGIMASSDLRSSPPIFFNLLFGASVRFLV